jgi:hypothetical protein
MKTCSVCGIEKNDDEFYYGYKKCKKCRYESVKEYGKKYREENKIDKEQKRSYNKEYYIENKEKEKERFKEWYEENKETKVIEYKEENKEKLKEYSEKYREENKEHIKKYNKKWYEDNKKHVSENKKIYHQENKDHLKECAKKWRSDNREKINERRRKWRSDNKDILSEKYKEKLKNDTLFKLKQNIRTRIFNSIVNQGYSKNSKTIEILGISYEEFKFYIESQFLEGMSWENYGKWHLDHKTPISWAKTEEEVYKLNHYTNFQPLWQFDNLSKGNKFESLKSLNDNG